MATAWTPIAWQSLASATATVTFSSIPGTYRDLRLVVQHIPTASTTFYVQLNGDSGGNYTIINAYGNGTTAGSGTSTLIGFRDTATFTTSTGQQSLSTFDILDYSATDKHKTALVRWNNAASGVEMSAQRWANTAAATSLTCTVANATTFAAGSTFALYGIA